jgi:hypothetical protein
MPMIKSLTAEVAALQQLSETEPLGLTLVEGGLCQNTCIFLATFPPTNLPCLPLGTCRETQRSTPKE